MNEFSQTQLANYAAFAGLLVLIANQFGLVWDANQVVFILASVGTLLSSAYNFYNRYKRGDITLGGLRK